MTSAQEPPTQDVVMPAPASLPPAPPAPSFDPELDPVYSDEYPVDDLAFDERSHKKFSRAIQALARRVRKTLLERRGPVVPAIEIEDCTAVPERTLSMIGQLEEPPFPCSCNPAWNGKAELATARQIANHPEGGPLYALFGFDGKLDEDDRYVGLDDVESAVEAIRELIRFLGREGDYEIYTHDVLRDDGVWVQLVELVFDPFDLEALIRSARPRRRKKKQRVPLSTIIQRRCDESMQRMLGES